MNSSKGDAGEERLARLRSTVETKGLSEFELRELDAWLESQMVGRQLDATLLDQFESGSHRETVKICRKLLAAAAEVAESLTVAGLPPSLEQKLFDGWAALKTPQGAEPDYARRSVEWEAGKARMVSDLESLQKVAEQALADLVRGGRRGRPTQAWRDTTFFCLFEKLHVAGLKQPKEATSHLAKEAWAIYFPAIVGDDVVTKIIKLRGKGRAGT